jgi:hypothetical protein
MTLVEGVIILLAFVVGFALRDFSLGKISTKLDLRKKAVNKETPKVSVLYPKTPESEKREEGEIIEKKLKDAGIGVLGEK